jgi:hypothetical protein
VLTVHQGRCGQRSWAVAREPGPVGYRAIVGGEPIIRDGRLPDPGEVAGAGRVIRAA